MVGANQSVKNCRHLANVCYIVASIWWAMLDLNHWSWLRDLTLSVPLPLRGTMRVVHDA